MSIHSTFYSDTPLSEDELRDRVPSIFTTVAHPDKSTKFQPVPTIQAVRALYDEGFRVYGGGESLTRKRFNRPYVKHMLKFRQHDAGPLHRVGDSQLEVVMVNANNGTSSYRLEAGVFRLACLNGMIVKSKDFGSFRVTHLGEDIVGRVVEGTQFVASQAEYIMHTPDRWSRITVRPFHQLALATRAHELRFGKKEERIKPGQLLQVRRSEDTGNDLWSIFNVIQENITMGGLHSNYVGGSLPVMRTRRTTGIDENLRLNRELWSYAEELAEELA
jgi:hypothetical protein